MEETKSDLNMEETSDLNMEATSDSKEETKKIDCVNLHLDHSLFCDEEDKQTQISLLDNFSKSQSRLWLCFVQKKFQHSPYQHWLVTDGVWTMEFGSNSRVNVHNHEVRSYIIHRKLTLTPTIRCRMEAVAGGSNYSVFLRNSEHLAKFICFGSWISLQMVPGSLFRKAFEEVIKIKEELINVIPEDLRSVVQHPRRILYKELKHDSSSVVRYIKTLDTLSKDDVDIEDCWNVVMMGPSGSGKATIINQLFNQNMCTSRSSSAPKIEILQGKFKDLKVNIFNVSGLCDSRLEDFEIRSFVNGAIKVNQLPVDVVVTICSGRISSCVPAIKANLKWLHYDPQQLGRFVFLCSKADVLSTNAQKERSLMDMGAALNVDLNFMANQILGDQKSTSLPMARATAFPPRSAFKDIKEERDFLKRQVFSPRDKSTKINMSKATCPIL